MSLEAYVTDIGKAKLAAAAAGGPPVVLAEGALGDGGGAVITPTPGMATLVNEVWRDDLSSVGLDPQNASCVLVEIVAPIDTGGYWVREVGIFDGEGDLFAVAAFPETYKPPLQDGSGTSLDISIPIPITDTAQVSLVVDAAKVWVTLQAMEAALAAHDADAEAHGDLAGRFAAQGHDHDDMYAPVVHDHPDIRVNTRIILTAPLTLYVSPTGSDAADGLSIDAPLATIQAAYDRLAQRYDLAGHTATILLAQGTYTEGVIASRPIPGGGQGRVILGGVPGQPATINAGGGICVACTAAGCNITVQHVLLQGSYGVTASNGGYLVVGQGVAFGAVSLAHIAAGFNGIIELAASYAVQGGGTWHITAEHGMVNVGAGPITVTMTGTPAFTKTVEANNCSYVRLGAAVTWVGGATGQRYLANTNGIIRTNGSGANYIPGNVAGSASNGGLYV